LSAEPSDSHDPFAALRVLPFNFFLFSRFFLILGIQMQTVIVQWQIYSLTKDVFTLGMIGLAEAIPFILISLVSGHVADSFNRKYIIQLCSFVFLLVTGFLWYITTDLTSFLNDYGTLPIFVSIVFVGVLRGFSGAAFPSFMAQIMPRKLYANAATWNSTVWHIASILGPASAGLLIAIDYSTAYAIDLVFILLSFLSFFLIASRPIPKRIEKERLRDSLSAGVRFVFKNELLLGALTLDLFAVLLGGAVALLPVFADKVLHAGPEELGFLRAAPAIGAVLMALLIAYKPPRANAGRNLLLSVSAFGLATILFGLSTNFYLAWFFLFLTGAFDNVSVVIRHTILQLCTPDDMRGRVSAVNGIFIGSSNEIGAFESGVTARAFGLKPSIIAGGILTILVVVITAKLSPKLRKLDIRELEGS
jgi:MFS family permease